MNGPVPTARSATAFSWINLGEIILIQFWLRSRSGFGVENLSFRPKGRVVDRLQVGKQKPPVIGQIVKSDCLAAVESNGVPSWNFTPGRRLKTYSVALLFEFQERARAGTAQYNWCSTV